jgi:hypothetical protein
MYQPNTQPGTKRAYVAPKLVEYGSVTELTQTPPAFALLLNIGGPGSITASAT